MSLSILISAIVSFLTVLILTPKVIKYFRLVGLTTTDVHKKNLPLIPHSAGVPVVSGMVLGLLTYIFINVFVYKNISQMVGIFAAVASILIINFSGFLDDLNVKQVVIRGRIEGKMGLKTWQKPILTIPAAIPLMAILAGDTTLAVPFFGEINFGIIYPLVIVPIGVFGAANMVNMLGGFNGLEAGMALVYTSSLALFAYLNGITISLVIFSVAATALLAILKFNFYPAKILPGDSLTYTLGAIVAAGAVLGNMEKAAVIVMLPFIVQGILKFYSLHRNGHFASDMGVLGKDGKIYPRKPKEIYSWTHIIMNFGKFTERQIVLMMIFIQLIFSVIPFLNII